MPAPAAPFRVLCAATLVALVGAAEAAALDPQLPMRAYVRDYWTTANGLPQNSVTAVTQTRDGYLWLGTFGGLARFDGVRFASSLEAGAPELGAARILALLEDRAGALWIGTEERGVARLRPGRLEIFGVAEGLASPLVWTLLEDSRGTIWAGTARGLARFENGRFVPEPLPAELGENPLVVSLAEDPSGRLWIGTFIGLALRSREGETRMAHQAVGPALMVHALVPESDGSIWVRTPGALSRFKRGTRLQELPYPIGQESVAGPVARDHDGNLWFAGEGLVRLAGDQVETLLGAEGLPGGRIRTIYEDREGGLWVGFDGGGLLRLRDANITAWNSREGLPQSVLPIVEDAAGTLWVGGSCGGLLRRDGERFYEVQHPDGSTYGCVAALAATRDGALWVGSDRLYRRSAAGAERAFGPADGLPESPVQAILEDRDGSVWIGFGGGLAHWRNGRFAVFDRGNGLVRDDVRILEQDREGAVWIGAFGGVARYLQGRFATWERDDGMPEAAVRSFWQAGDGAMWAGTYGAGVVRFAGGELRRFDVREGFTEGVVSRFLEDDQGDLWLSGLRGLARVPRGQLEDLGAGRREQITPTLYGLSDGMPTVECNGGGQPAGWRARDGRLLFPTVAGIAVVDPSRMRRNALAPPVHIEAALVNRRAVELAALATLPPGRTEIEIRYTGLSFSAPERVRFRYRLEGYDADWVEAGTRRTAFYTNVPPGKYRFVVRAANGDGVWNETGASLPVALAPALHQTAWFPLLVAAAVGAMGAGAASWRLRHLRRRKRELETLIDERTRELVELNSHLEQRVSENTVEIRATRDMALFALARLAELRDSTTAEHLERIGAYSRRLAEAARPRFGDAIDPDFIEDIGRSSPLHDIGKVAIPDAILRKPGRLTPDELEIMRRHTTIGGDTLREVLRNHQRPSFLAMAMDIAYHHHERWDGMGYPRRLGGEEIPLPARIVALVDAYDALTSERPYKPALGHEESVRRILADRGTHFDPVLVDVFADLAGEFRDIRRAVDGRAVN